MHKSREKSRQIQETINKIDDARAWVENAAIKAKSRLDQLEEAFPDLLARRAMGEASHDEVAECRTRIARLRESVGECNLALTALERRRDAAQNALTRAKHHLHNPAKNDPDPDEELAVINERGYDQDAGEIGVCNSLMTPEEL